MSHSDVRLEVLKSVVAALPSTFATRDVSESRVMRDAHPALAQHGHYHAFVGRALSVHRTDLELDEVAKGTSRGSRWTKRRVGGGVAVPAGSRTAEPVASASVADIDVDVLAEVIADQRDTFATRDVSEDRRVNAAHPHVRSHPNFHGLVGRAISVNRGRLCVDELRKGSSRGSIWEKTTGAAVVAEPRPTYLRAAVAPPADPPWQPDDLGPQYHADSRFTARMRRHQSWYRAHVLKLPYGTGPTPQEASRYGNMLTREDGARGANFVTPAIGRYALERVRAARGAVEPYRLLHNMLSSQPMCFNLFVPLAQDLASAVPLVQTLVPERVASVTRVDLEWAPIPADEYLGDRTAFDAAIEYRTTDGRRGLLGIETKLTEPFSPGEYDRQTYRRWMEGPRAPWGPAAGPIVHRTTYNQLWRDHLLAIALRDHPRSRFDVCRLMVVHHPEDRDCQRVLDGYRELLQEADDTLLSRPLDQLVADWRPHATTDGARAWLDALETRYLALHLSL